MNKEIYENILEGLNKLDILTVVNKASGVDQVLNNPTDIRERLVESLPKSISASDAITVLAAFYDYTSKRADLDFLTDYERKVFNSYYPVSKIESNYDLIIKDELLLDKLISMGSDELVQSLVDIAFKNNKDYALIVEKCKNANRNIKQHEMSDSAKEFLSRFNNINVDDVKRYEHTHDDSLQENFAEIVNKAEKNVSQSVEASKNEVVDVETNKAIDDKVEQANQRITRKIESAKNIVDVNAPLNSHDLSQSDLDYFSEEEISSEERKQRYENINAVRTAYHEKHDAEIKEEIAKKTEELNNNGISISQKSLEKTLNKNNIDITKYDVNVSKKFTLLNSSRIGQKITALMFKYADTSVVQVMGDDKKKVIVSPNNTFMRIAACNQAKFKIIKAVKETKQKVVDKIFRASNNAKNTIVKMANDTKDISIGVKDKVNDKINENREKIADSLYNAANRVSPNETYVKKLSQEEIDEIINSFVNRKGFASAGSQVATINNENLLTTNEEIHSKTA